ncbi:hypothetical protein MYCTH_2311961 [Thermothelomyces thermophilus ATCC 42464]|uniref:Uncharacterized protein n=1 Tax=Thermothelomyces thermophilus (strain ATCC 42464 / BCRC 31852 / DSM 1799) TaxID=573729 RepID=G2QPW1_THET4|nr:uncharacterized protein MYCTH_2311961 [Thermothelomyces thermophilus ATCC 42464]AEO61624.1 hypothetical protein MYCTH_2311961 [Thermothelomyces thermophilus ATCC 42464]
MEGRYVESAYAMGPRIPVRRRAAISTTVSTLGFRVPSRILVARADSDECKNPNGCTKPIGASTTTIAIVLGIFIPFVVAISVLFYLHRRNVRKQRQEDLHDPHKSLDFGLEGGGPAKESRKNLISREKEGGQRFNRQQMSMDMNLSSPYLLPPDAHNSRESLNSLAKSLQQNEDPYKPVAQYAGSDVGSIRSFRRGNEAPSVYSRSRQNSIPMSPLQPPEPSHTRPEQPLPESAGSPAGAPTNGPLPPIGTAVSDSPDGQNDKSAIGTAIQEPPAAVPKSLTVPQPSRSQPSPPDSGVAVEYGDAGRNPFEKPVAQEVETPTEPSAVGLGLSSSPPQPQRASIRSSTSSYKSRAASPPPQKEQNAPMSAPVIEEPRPVGDYDFDFAEMPEMPQDRRSPSPSPANHNSSQLDVDEPRGRNMQRTSHLFEQQNTASQGGLGVPQQDNRRLSVGFRPLPPDDIMESEDPEYRANRIRSFYKEYFDDTKAEDRPPVPPMPPMGQNGHQHQHHQSNASYYEDYDANYIQDAPYFDPATNSFVMPYAQPVSRRAMTPPPSGQRFPGPRGPPRGSHGSQASARFPPNMRGPPRPGSSVSNQLGGPSRPGSAASGPYGRVRAGSAMSGSRSGSRAPKKPVPPPADLPTLPTPSKLADDSFALLNAADFAPPETFAERARGRSQSPSGERRPYRMPVPAHSPLASSYDELPALPSPHLLRKSGTFTALDFAPPRKFADPETASDAGSIRSNRSGLSALHVNAIRNGAGRVSRLPGDQVFTQAALSKTLKPQWGMRD